MNTKKTGGNYVKLTHEPPDLRVVFQSLINFYSVYYVFRYYRFHSDCTICKIRKGNFISYLSTIFTSIQPDLKLTVPL